MSSQNAKIQTGRNISFCVTEMLRGRLFPCLTAFFNTHHTRSRHSKTGFTAGPWKIPSLAMFWFSHSWAHRDKIHSCEKQKHCAKLGIFYRLWSLSPRFLFLRVSEDGKLRFRLFYAHSSCRIPYLAFGTA